LGEPLEGLQICDGDDDWYRLVVPEANGGWILRIQASFRAGVDIDVYVYDEFGNLVGSATSPDQTDEVAELRFIAPGGYYVRVDQFSSDRLVDTAYSFSAEVISNDEACTVEGGECDRTDPLRSQCDVESGGCRAIEGNGEVGLGERCDSNDDCSNDAEFCWSFEGGGPQSICTIRCRADSDCGGVQGTVCQRFRQFGACLPPR
jgi:hypothetical protein